MKALKTFINGQGRRIKSGDILSRDDYDADTIRHYLRHGMVSPAPAPVSPPPEPMSPAPAKRTGAAKDASKDAKPNEHPADSQ